MCLILCKIAMFLKYITNNYSSLGTPVTLANCMAWRLTATFSTGTSMPVEEQIILVYIQETDYSTGAKKSWEEPKDLSRCTLKNLAKIFSPPPVLLMELALFKKIMLFYQTEMFWSSQVNITGDQKQQKIFLFINIMDEASLNIPSLQK